MGYQVALSPSARRDLRESVRYISPDSPERAVNFGRLLISNTSASRTFLNWAGSCRSLAIRPFAKLLSVPTASSTGSITPIAGWTWCASGTARAGLPKSERPCSLVRFPRATCRPPSAPKQASFASPGRSPRHCLLTSPCRRRKLVEVTCCYSPAIVRQKAICQTARPFQGMSNPQVNSVR